jgi:hypothetical protein
MAGVDVAQAPTCNRGIDSIWVPMLSGWALLNRTPIKEDSSVGARGSGVG